MTTGGASGVDMAWRPGKPKAEPSSDNATPHHGDASLLASSLNTLESEVCSTPSTPISTTPSSVAGSFEDLKHYIALGTLHVEGVLPRGKGPALDRDWSEIIHSGLPEEVKLVIGNEASRLLDARWIRLFQHRSPSPQTLRRLVRIYLLPEDWGRRFVDRNSRILKAAIRQLLQQIDISPEAWNGDYREAKLRDFDPWASAENVSLYYLFNKLPSPNPDPLKIQCRYTRAAVRELLQSAASSEWEDHGEQPLAGLRTRLYPYQARSASLMIEREAAPQLQLDPRLEIRESPTGEVFYYAPRDGSFLQEPRFYEANRGGILAETMGLGKTIICLAVILTTRGHYPRIPAAYVPPLAMRNRVARLSDMAASIIGRCSIPARALIEQSEINDNVQYSHLKKYLDNNMPFYEIPPDLPRMNRNTYVPPPRQFVLCPGTIIVVPRNLLHQWQSEIKKHVLEDGLRVLIVDSVSKRSGKKRLPQNEETMAFVHDLPPPTELMRFDIVLFTRTRFEMEIQDGADSQGRRAATGASRSCDCTYIGATRIPDCNCVTPNKVYESPLRKLHWLRIIIDEGHSFSSSVSNAVLVAKQIQAERRWVVSGTPAKNLVGVEVDLSMMDLEETNVSALRESAIENRKSFSSDTECLKATKALGSLASHFLMVQPWCDSIGEGKLDWDEYVYRHENLHKKTYSAFSACFLRTLEGLVVKTRPEDVEKDIVLPPMRHRVVYLQPCWYDKMTANLFVQVLRANAITSERSDVDYLFHKNSVKARHSLIRNLRQSNFTWTGFGLDDVISTLETTEKYLNKEDKKCSPEDMSSLLESSQAISCLKESTYWRSLSKAHEVGMALEKWPIEHEESFSFAFPAKPTMIGITQLLDAQLHVDSNVLASDPASGLNAVGEAAKARIEVIEAEDTTKATQEKAVGDQPLNHKSGVPSSCIGGQQPITSRRALKAGSVNTRVNPSESGVPASPVRQKKRKLTFEEERAELSADSKLRNTSVTGTTSAKLTYLLDKVVQHQATEKIIIFYDGDNAAFYIAQCLELLYINHRIYARTLDNTKRSEYVALFNRDPDIRVLLIDVACGALGLNLNAASVVLIVNPINRPGLEAQAIKRAHRIGQTKPVLVETLILENTIEHAIFNRAKKMSRAQHMEAKELEDDEGIVEIIQNAQVLPILPSEMEGDGMFAKLQTPQQVFGRPDRHKYHRFGLADSKKAEVPKKKAKTTKNEPGLLHDTRLGETDLIAVTPNGLSDAPAGLPNFGASPGHGLGAPLRSNNEAPVSSLFGGL